jgi:hypothetical protein
MSGYQISIALFFKNTKNKFTDKMLLIVGLENNSFSTWFGK